MVQRSHPENAFPIPQLVAPHLQHHAQCLENKHAANKRQQQLLLDHHRHRPNRPAQRQRSYISHEDLRRMCVVPEKPDTRPHHRPAKHSELTHHRHPLHLQVVRKHGMAAHIGQHRQRPGRDDRAPDRQPIQPIRQIHRIARSGNHDHDKQHKRKKRQPLQVRHMPQAIDDQIRPEVL